jgi:amino-acid N-acetyltransferase
MVQVEPARPSDLGYVEALLERNGLPHEDVRDGAVRLFVASIDGERIGVGGLERCGTAALLRSVVVEADERENGHGAALCAELEGRAAAAGVAELYLLTTTAPAFFARLGFERIAREDAPAAMRATSEFAELCPDAAICMRKAVQ